MATSNIQVDLSGLADDELIRAALPQLRDIRHDATADAEFHCPVDTGHLKSTVYGDLDETTGVIEVGARADYALYVEMGHRSPADNWVPAQPFLRPAALRYGSTT